MARKKILLVDDAETILVMEQMILAKGDYDLVTAKDGEEAIVKAAVHKPDLILLDVVMPKVSGFEVCRRLRQSDPTRTTPIIMVTTRGESINVEQGYGSGCTDYVNKPINGPDLLAKVKSYLGE